MIIGQYPTTLAFALLMAALSLPAMALDDYEEMRMREQGIPVQVDTPNCYIHLHPDNSSPIKATGIKRKHPSQSVAAARDSIRFVRIANIQAPQNMVDPISLRSLHFHLSRQANLVNKGDMGEFSFQIPGNVSTMIELESDGSATFNATYITPDNTILQPGSGVEIESMGCGASGFTLGPVEHLHIDAAHATAGTWKIAYAITSVCPDMCTDACPEICSEACAEVEKSHIALRVLETGPSLSGTFAQSSEFVRETQNGGITVSLWDGSTPAQGATVQVHLSKYSTITLVESTKTPGVYEGAVPVDRPQPSYRLSVVYAGITRHAGIWVNTLPANPAGGLGTTFTDQGIASPKNGLYDLLDIAIPVTVDKTQEYTIHGTLRTSSGKTISSQASASLIAGANSMHLQFDGETIYYGTGDDGPYTIENLRLYAPNDLIDVLDSSYQTAPYSVNLFQHQVVDIDVTQPVISNAVDTNQDGKFDYLQVTIPIVSTEKTASFYKWSASLYDTKGMLLSLSFNCGTITPGFSTITLDFNVDANQYAEIKKRYSEIRGIRSNGIGPTAIGPNAMDGPFRLDSFAMHGSGKMGWTNRHPIAQITTPSIDQFDGFMPCLLTTTDISFPSIQLPNQPVAKTWSVTNAGSGRCVLTGVTISSADFAVKTVDFPLVLEVGATANFVVNLVKPTSGNHTAILTLKASGNQQAVATAAVMAKVTTGTNVSPNGGVNTD